MPLQCAPAHFYENGRPINGLKPSGKNGSNPNPTPEYRSKALSSLMNDPRGTIRIKANGSHTDGW